MIFLVGCHATGKSEIAKILKEEFNFLHIETSEIVKNYKKSSHPGPSMNEWVNYINCTFGDNYIDQIIVDSIETKINLDFENSFSEEILITGNRSLSGVKYISNNLKTTYSEITSNNIVIEVFSDEEILFNRFKQRDREEGDCNISYDEFLKIIKNEKESINNLSKIANYKIENNFSNLYSLRIFTITFFENLGFKRKTKKEIIKENNLNNVNYIEQFQKYYFNNPEIWEKLRFDSHTSQVEFLSGAIKKFNPKANKILDVGCGTGLHAIALQKLHYQVKGLDKNSKMIEYAKSKGSSVNFEIGDMQYIDSKEKFDVVLCLCSTFTYNISNEDICKTLSNFSNVLNDNGIVIIEVFNPISFYQSNKLTSNFFFEDVNNYLSIGFISDVKHFVDEKNQLINEERIIFDIKKNEVINKEYSKFRMFYPKEFEYFLNQNNLEILEVLGRFDLNYKKLDKSRMIFIAKRKQ